MRQDLRRHGRSDSADFSDNGDRDYIVAICGVDRRADFFKEVLAFYAPCDVTLSVWAHLPSETTQEIASFRIPCPWWRRWFLGQSDWSLQRDSLPALSTHLCDARAISTIRSWGIRRGGTPLALCRTWDDLNVDGSTVISDGALFEWIEQLKASEIIRNYEKISGD
jgi:hypothetical protein